MTQGTRASEPSPSEKGWDPRRVLEVVLGVPATDGNHVRVPRNGDEIFPAMLDAIGAARSVDFLTFVYREGEIARRVAAALADRAAAGVRIRVRVRVILDHVGARRIDDVLAELINLLPNLATGHSVGPGGRL